MAARHFVLVIAAVAVLGLGVYLKFAVGSDASATVRPEAPAAREVRETPRAEEAPRPPEGRRERPSPPGTPPTIVPDQAVAPTERPADINIQKDELMASANKAYDHGDFDEAMLIAKKVLASDPSNVRMLRIMISSSCLLDDTATAQRNYLLLPAAGNDRADMRRRCDRYGVTFTET